MRGHALRRNHPIPEAFSQQGPLDIIGDTVDPALRDEVDCNCSIHAADRKEQVCASPRHQFIRPVDRHFGLAQSPRYPLHRLFCSANYKQLRCWLAREAFAHLLGVDLDPTQHMIDVGIQDPCFVEPKR